MIGISSNSGSYINFLVPRHSSGSAKQPLVSEVVPGNIAPPSPAISDVLQTQMDAYQKHWAEASRAIAQLNTNSQDMAQSKKAAAAQKLERIKEQIKMLMRMGGIGDPKVNARQIAQLAKELAAAAQEYASAGGGGSPQQPATSADTAAAISGANDTASNSTQSNSNVASDVSAATSGAPALSGTSGENSLNADVVLLPATGAALVDSSGRYQDMKERSDNNFQNKIAELQQKSSSDDADNKFVTEVRNLAKQLKALAKLQEKRLLQAGVQAADNEMANAIQAINEVEKIATSIASSIAVVSSVNVFA